MKRKPHLIAVDAGSSDPGPYYLGAGVSFTDRGSVKRDLSIMLGAAVSPKYAMPHVPADTIVIHGEHDEVISLAQVLDWARPQSLPVVVFPGVGHFFHGKLVLLQQYVQRLIPAV